MLYVRGCSYIYSVYAEFMYAEFTKVGQTLLSVFFRKRQTGVSVPLPIENIPPHRVPAHPIGKADGIGGGEQLLAHEQLGRL
ncbi:MAG: hypothetical protein ACI9TH_001052, partial [Kiritimatiellia bacterium]